LQKRTPLSRATEKGDKAVVELLLKHGPQPDLEDENGCGTDKFCQIYYTLYLIRRITVREVTVPQVFFRPSSGRYVASRYQYHSVIETLTAWWALTSWGFSGGASPLDQGRDPTVCNKPRHGWDLTSETSAVPKKAEKKVENGNQSLV